MLVDLHNHTTLCNHAKGTIDSYIQAAISCGTRYFGFSDHAPMDYDLAYRMGFSQMREYEDAVLSAKKKYQDKIEILLGYEVDYLMPYLDDRVLNADVDYLIGSVHFLDDWGFDNPEFIEKFKNRDIDTIYRDYFQSIQAMAKSRKFDIVGHLDLIKVFKFMPTKDTRLLAYDALKAIKQSNMVLELNAAGLRKPVQEIYPSKTLLEEAYALDIPITFSSDAHAVDQVGYGYKEVLALAREVGYTKAVTFQGRDKQLITF